MFGRNKAKKRARAAAMDQQRMIDQANAAMKAAQILSANRSVDLTNENVATVSSGGATPAGKAGVPDVLGMLGQQPGSMGVQGMDQRKKRNVGPVSSQLGINV